MRVILAKTAGFCMGVRRAMDIVFDAAHRKDGPVHTEGPLIHNPQVLDLLARKGVTEIDETSDLSSATVVVRAHGITPERRRQLKERGARLCDATCPHVARVQGILKKHTTESYSAVIVGDKGHGEVVGLQGFALDGGHVISSLEEVERLPAMEKVCVVAQTTQNRKLYEAITDRIRQRFPDAKVFDTICDSTSQRQDEVRSLCQSVEAMVVVGAHNSANTTRLAQICREGGKPTFHVETEDDLDLGTLRPFHVVGVTAGASTPTWMIRRVVQKIQSLRRERRPWAVRLALDATEFLIKSNIYVAAGAAALAYANCVLLDVQHKLVSALVAAFYMFSMHVVNEFADREAQKLNDPARAAFYERHAWALVSLAIGLALVSIVIAGLEVSWIALLLLVVASVLGGMYRVRLLPEGLFRSLRYRRLADMPCSRELFLALAWCVTAVVIPLLAEHERLSPAFGVALAFTFALSFTRAALLDIRDIQGDRIVGKETMPIVLGKPAVKVILAALLLAVAALLFFAPGLGWCSPLSYGFLACTAYAAAYLWLYHLRLIGDGYLCEGVVDANFLLAGLVAYVGQAW